MAGTDDTQDTGMAGGDRDCAAGHSIEHYGGGTNRRADAEVNIKLRLERETEVARALLSSLGDLIDDDEDLVATTVEGETALVETIRRALARTVEIDAISEVIDKLAEGLAARKARLTRQRNGIREAIAVAMEECGLRKLELGLATISLKAVPPKVEIVEEGLIPAAFWKIGEPTLDRRDLLKVLKEGAAIPGAQLSNGGMTISVRTK